MNLNSINLAVKLWTFIVFVILGIVSVGTVGLIKSQAIVNEGRLAQEDALEVLNAATTWVGLSETNAARNQAILLSSEPAVVNTFKDVAEETTRQISDLQKKIEGLLLKEDDKAQFAKLSDLRKSVIDARIKIRALKEEDKKDEALDLMKAQYLPAMRSYLAAIRDFVTVQQQRVLEIQASTEERRQGNATFMLAGNILILILILIGTYWLIGSIKRPLGTANALAARIAQGDLTMPIQTDRGDEFGLLLHSLGTMNDSLRAMVSKIREGTDNIATASSEIATGNNDLAQRTEQTSSNLQETASSMGSITTTVQHSTDNARQASTLAASAYQDAQRGGDVVKEVVTTMQEIDASSKKISDITSVIDGIAFQTNILALNAAVEAARAGEQGRGFAVVASEVRSLAQRSAVAAKEIKELISTSVIKIESGTQLVNDAGSRMQEMVVSVQRVASVISEITDAANAQNTGIAGVNQAISNLDQMTQQNAALVEQSAAAAEGLKVQANLMKEAVSVFKL